MPLVGGFLADRFLGYNRSVMIGAVLMGLGYLSVAMGTLPLFFAGLALVATGNGFLKPNISTIVGNLYRDRPAAARLGFNIFYMGINIGAFLSPLVVSYLRARYGWHVAFASARRCDDVRACHLPLLQPRCRAAARKVAAGSARGRDRSAADEARGQGPSAHRRLRHRGGFWVAFYQNGFTLTFWARDNTTRRALISPERFQSVNPLCIILFTPLLVRWGVAADRRAEPSTPGRSSSASLFTTGAFLVMMMAALLVERPGKVSPALAGVSYSLISLGEICAQPDGPLPGHQVAPPQRPGTADGRLVRRDVDRRLLLGNRSGRGRSTMPHAQFFLLVTLTAP